MAEPVPEAFIDFICIAVFSQMINSFIAKFNDSYAFAAFVILPRTERSY